MNLRPLIGLAVLGFLIAAPAALSSVAARHNGVIAYAVGTRVRLITPSGAPVATLPHCAIRHCNDAGSLAWSPGGRKLAFLRGAVHGGIHKPNKLALFVSSANGTHLRRLLGCDCGLDVTTPTISWSPGGSNIVVSDRRRLEVVNAKTGSHRLIGSCAAGSGLSPWSPAWSPAGFRIAYACGASLYLVSRNGNRAHAIVTVPGQIQVGHLSWSPDGSALAFDSADTLYTVDADGSHLRTLLSGAAGSGPGFPTWSRDGTRILYAYTPGTPSHFFFEVWVMNADGTQTHRLYRSSQILDDYAAPIWSPDGQQVAFAIATDAQSGLMIMNADESDLHSIASFVPALAWQRLG